MVRRRTRTERPTHPTKQLLIDTVLRLISTVPVEQLTCDEVLRESGVSRGSLYHHFEDYPDLIEHALATRFAASVDASIQTFATAVRTSNSADDFRLKVLAFNRDTQSPQRQATRLDRVVAFASAANSPRFREVLATQQQRLTDAQADAIAEAQERGWVRADVDSHALAVFVQAYTLGRVVDDVSVHPVDADAWAKLIGEVLERTFFAQR